VCAAAAIARLALPICRAWVIVRSVIEAQEAALSTADQWLACPCEEHRLAAERAAEDAVWAPKYAALAASMTEGKGYFDPKKVVPAAEYAAFEAGRAWVELNRGMSADDLGRLEIPNRDHDVPVIYRGAEVTIQSLTTRERLLTEVSRELVEWALR
jgi:hypothetical protein